MVKNDEKNILPLESSGYEKKTCKSANPINIDFFDIKSPCSGKLALCVLKMPVLFRRFVKVQKKEHGWSSTYVRI